MFDRLVALLLNVGLYSVVRYCVKVIKSQSVCNTISPATYRLYDKLQCVSHERTNLMIVAETATVIKSFIATVTSR